MFQNKRLPAGSNQEFEQFQQGDSSAFRSFYEEHFGLLCLTIQHMVGQLELAEDIVSTAFSKLYDRRATIKEPRQVGRFLLVVARNEAISQLRARQRHRAAHKEQEHLLDREHLDPGETERERAQRLEKILELVELLPAAEKRVVKMSFAGLSSREIAHRLNRSEQTVRNQRSRAVNFLRQAFF